MQSIIKFSTSVFILALVSCGGSGNEGSKDSAATTNNTEQKVDKPSNDQSNVPASERVDMVNKGVGPIKNVDIPETIDRKMAVEGKAIYDTKCVACHNIDHKLIGPPQKGIMKKRTAEWVMNMIMNPTEMLEKDPIAKDMLEEFNGIPMLDQNITEKEARAIVEYFRTL